MLNQEELDNQIRQLLQGHVANPPASAWSQIDQKLPKNAGRRRYLLFWLLPIGICVAGSAFYYMGWGNKTASPLATNQYKIEKINHDPISNRAELKNNEKHGEKLEGSYHKANNLNTKLNPVISLSDNKQVGTNHHLFAYAATESGVKNDDLNKQDQGLSINKDILSPSTENKVTSLTYLSPILIPQNTLENKLQEPNHPGIKRIKQVGNSGSKIGLSGWQFGIEMEPGWETGSAPAMVQVTTVRADSDKNSQGLYATHSSSEKYAYKSSGNTQFSFGFSLGFRPSKHLVISSGFFYKNITQKYVPDYGYQNNYISSYSIPASTGVSEYDFNYHYFSIPLQLKYQFSSAGRFGFYVNGGGAYNMLWYASTGTGFPQLEYSSMPAYTTGTGSKAYSYSYTTMPFSLYGGFTGFSTNLGTGISWILSPKISLQAGISLNYMISGISSDNKNNLLGITVPVGVYFGL